MESQTFWCWFKGSYVYNSNSCQWYSKISCPYFIFNCTIQLIQEASWWKTGRIREGIQTEYLGICSLHRKQYTRYVLDIDRWSMLGVGGKSHLKIAIWSHICSLVFNFLLGSSFRAACFSFGCLEITVLNSWSLITTIPDLIFKIAKKVVRICPVNTHFQRAGRIHLINYF